MLLLSTKRNSKITVAIYLAKLHPVEKPSSILDVSDLSQLAADIDDIIKNIFLETVIFRHKSGVLIILLNRPFILIQKKTHL